MAHKKGASSSRNGRDSKAKRLGVKALRRPDVKRGRDLVRRARHVLRPGEGVFGRGGDDTLFALVGGKVVRHVHGSPRRARAPWRSRQE